MKKSTETRTFGNSSRSNHNSEKFYNSRLYKELNKNIVPNNLKAKKVYVENNLPEKYINKIILKSSVNMEEITDSSIHLMVTSPPYNVSKDYDEDLSLNEYLTLLTTVFSETYRVLVDGGRACINLANIGRKPYLPLTDMVSQIMLEIGFKMRGEIIWDKGSSVGSSTAWGSWKSASNPTLRDVHEYILVFSKGDFKRNNKNKINTITRDDFMSWTKSIWQFKTESAKKIGHPAPYPIELPRRLIQLYTFQDDIVLDPFMGSGTTAIASLMSERKFIGYEIDKDYIELANERINPYKSNLFVKD